MSKNKKSNGETMSKNKSNRKNPRASQQHVDDIDQSIHKGTQSSISGHTGEKPPACPYPPHLGEDEHEGEDYNEDVYQIHSLRDNDMEEVDLIQAKQAWPNDTLLDLVIRFAKEKGHMPSLEEYLRRIADEENSLGEEDHLPCHG